MQVTVVVQYRVIASVPGWLWRLVVVVVMMTMTPVLETVLYTVLDSLLIVGESLVKLKWIWLLKRGGGGFLNMLVHFHIILSVHYEWLQSLSTNRCTHCATVCFSLFGCYMFQLFVILRELRELFGCELPQIGDQPKLVGARWGEIYIYSIIYAFVGAKRL